MDRLRNRSYFARMTKTTQTDTAATGVWNLERKAL